jgi:predicted nucleotidyltransferase
MSVSHLIERFTAACEADPRVVAAFLAGSHARGDADDHSDVDFGVVATDDGFEALWADRTAFVARLGEPIFLEDFGTGMTVFFILADGTEVEVSFGRRSDFGEISTGAYRALVDKEGVLDGAVFTGQVADPAEQGEMVRQLVWWFWHEVSHLVAALGRGELWWAAGQLDALRGHCVNLARLAEGTDAVEEPYEKIDAVVPPDRLVPLAATYVPLERDAMIAAAEVLVRFYRTLAPTVAESHGVAYPSALEAVMVGRLERLARRGDG